MLRSVRSASDAIARQRPNPADDGQDQVLVEAMVPFFGLGAIAFLLIALAPTVLPGRTLAVAGAVTSAVTSVALGATWAALRSRRYAAGLRRRSRQLGWATALLACANPIVEMLASRHTYPSAGMLLLIVGVGALLHSSVQAVTIIVGVNAAWIAMASSFGLSVSVSTFAFVLARTDALALILHAVRVRSVSRLERARYDVQSLAATDHLTGLANRRGLLTTGARAFRRCRQDGNHATVLYLDVDGLKEINDRHGHAAGDEHLRTMGATLAAVFRPHDIVARMGGDEFAVLITDPMPDPLDSIIERIHIQLAAAKVTASIGSSSTRSAPASSLEDLVQAADLAMYSEKMRRKAADTRSLRREPDQSSAPR